MSIINNKIKSTQYYWVDFINFILFWQPIEAYGGTFTRKYALWVVFNKKEFKTLFKALKKIYKLIK